MTYPESCIFIFVLCAVLAIPIGIAVHTLLAMKERVFVPILRVRTASGDIHSYLSMSTIGAPASQSVPELRCIDTIQHIQSRRGS
jgi:hypothetical protein